MILDQFVDLWCSQCPRENAKFTRLAFCSHMKYKCSVSFPHWTGLQFFLSFLSEPIINLVSHLFFSLRWRREHGNSLTFLSAERKNSFMKVTMSGHRPCFFFFFLSGRHHGGGKQVLGPFASQNSAPANSHMQNFCICEFWCLSSSRDIRNPGELLKPPGFQISTMNWNSFN